MLLLKRSKSSDKKYTGGFIINLQIMSEKPPPPRPPTYEEYKNQKWQKGLEEREELIRALTEELKKVPHKIGALVTNRARKETLSYRGTVYAIWYNYKEQDPEESDVVIMAYHPDTGEFLRLIVSDPRHR